jgi:TPR repeat protein
VSVATGVVAVRRRMAIAWAIGLLFGAGAASLAAHAARALPPPRPLEELSYYPSGAHLEPASFGHAESAADLAWLRAVQYYGEHRATDSRFLRMAHVFDILTTLSPRFIDSYVFGAFALAQEGNDFPAAERLLQKGVEANPLNSELAFEMGFLYYVRPGGRDLGKAAEYFERAARLPNPPPTAARFAAFAHQQSGDLAVAYAMWADVRERSPNRYMRQIAEDEMSKIREALATGHIGVAVHKLSTPIVLLK